MSQDQDRVVDLDYADFKSKFTDLGKIRYSDKTTFYLIFARDGYCLFETSVLKDSGSNQIDFETNIKPYANIPDFNPTVTTQFEKRDKTLKLATASASVGEDGIATIFIKIPGTPGTSDGRWLSSGTAFFDTQHIGDKIMMVKFTDEDNILGEGTGTTVGSYTDEDLLPENEGWYIPPCGYLKAEPIGGYGFAPAGFYIKVVGKKGSGITTGTLYVNLEWAKQDI